MLDRTEQEYMTAGGIPVYAFPSEHLHGFALSLYVRGGALFETETHAGISHLIEHLVFRSINRHMGGTLYQTLDRLGLTVEGVTYREFLQFTVTGAPKHFSTAAHILSLALAPLSLSKEDLETERARVKAEIREDGENENGDLLYSVTAKGAIVAEQLRCDLLPSILDQSLACALRYLDFKKRGIEGHCSSTKRDDGRYDVTCTFTEKKPGQGTERRVIFTTTLAVDSENRAERMKKNFMERPDVIYRGVIALLSGNVNFLFD